MTSKLTITRERLEKIKSWRETYGAGSNVMLPAEEAEELARMVLAAMDSEPVAEVCEDYAIRYISNGPAPVEGLHPGDKLYRHAQPASVVMPDAWPRKLIWSHHDDISQAEVLAWNNAIDACRAAMRQAGNSPVIPDGYVMVPKDPTAEMQSAGASAIRFDTTAVNKLWTGNAVFRSMLAAAPQPQDEPQNIPEIIPDSCTWHCEEEINNWHGDCGYQFQFMEDGPEENGVKFCPKCGKSVAVPATE